MLFHALVAMYEHRLVGFWAVKLVTGYTKEPPPIGRGSFRGS